MRQRGPMLLALTALCVVATMLPASLRPLVVLVAFACGIAFARPEKLRQWTRSARTPVAAPYAGGAVIAVAATVAVLELGSATLSGSLAGLAEPFLPDGRTETGARRRTSESHSAKTPPNVKVVKRALDSPFMVEGVRFRVMLISDRNATPGKLTRVVSLGVSGHNVQRDRFNSNRLIYRLKDHQGRHYSSLTGGGTGPRSLAKTGFFKRGETARTRLTFRVPKSARRLVLAFEPSFDATFQVQVPLKAG